jgi:FkbM family methyltransferase
MDDAAELARLLEVPAPAYEAARAGRWADATRTAPVLVFGPGNNGRMLARAMRESGRGPEAFVSDVSPAQGTIDGLRVLSPATAGELYKRSAVVIVSPFVPWHSYRRTRARLAEFGLATLSIFEALAGLPRLLPFYFFASASDVTRNAHALRTLLSRLIDQRSHRELVEHVRFRLTGQLDGLPEPIGSSFGYFDPLIDSDTVFIDGGAFDGDTLRALLSSATFARCAAIEALEPDPTNFAKLSAYHAQLPAPEQSRIHIHAKGLWSHRARVGFVSTGSLDAAVQGDAPATVDVVDVDALVPSSTRALIKLDVEGAERQAIQGARRAIGEERALLAVAAYHRPGDLWELSEEIVAINPRYSFALRSHADDGADLMLYALPPRAAALAREGRMGSG